SPNSRATVGLHGPCRALRQGRAGETWPVVVRRAENGHDGQCPSCFGLRRPRRGCRSASFVASEISAYKLTDRATWLNFKNGRGLEILTEVGPSLFNPYGSILVNPAEVGEIEFQRGQDLARMAYD